jgi:hypothetical protein
VLAKVLIQHDGIDKSLTVLVPSTSDEDVNISARASSNALSENGRHRGQEKRRKGKSSSEHDCKLEELTSVM